MNFTAAVVERQHGPFVLRSLRLDAPRPDEVLVRVEASGICHSDLIFVDSPMLDYPVLLGHEGAGTVESVGSAVTTVAPGDRVVMSFASCGACARCRKGRPAYCAQFWQENMGGRRSDGSSTVRADGDVVQANFFGQSSFATHALCREHNLVRLDADVPVEIAAPLGCGVQTGAGAVLNTLRPAAGDSLVVFGAGSVGLSALMAAAACGAGPLAVVEPHRSRRELALKLGAVAAIDPAAGNLADQLRDVSGGGFDCALDTSGQPGVIRAAFDSLAAEGRLALVASQGDRDAEVSFPIGRLIEGRRVQGLIEGEALPGAFIPQLVRMWRQGRFPVERLVQTFGLDQINHAVEAMRKGVVVKPVLVP